MTLLDFLPPPDEAADEVLLERFLEYTESIGIELYPAQETAILELFEGKNVILNTPTGSGKSLVAAALHFKALAQGRRSIYTCPIKALVNEKWMALCREFGPENVGLSTGDATVNRDAPILCCTAEILANIALREGVSADVDEVVSDEFHYYADRDRGVAWQVPILVLEQARFLLMSATLGDTAFFESELTRLNGRPSVTVRSDDRPVPLEYSYVETPLAATLQTLVAEGKSPIYVVHFTQLEAAQSAQDSTSIDVCTKSEKAALAAAVEAFKFTSPYGPVLKRWLRHGIGLHHAGLLPKYRVLAEQLAQKNLLKIICGTDTLGVGINVPIRTVVFTRLCKFDGRKTGILSAREFHQIAGRAGRKGFDDRGWVVVQAPEHVIENLKFKEKKKREGKKYVARKPPDRNFVAWDLKTYARLVGARPERLTSQFQVSHGMLLNVLSRGGDACGAMRDLIRRCHDPEKAKTRHRRRAWQLFRALLGSQILEIVPRDEDGTYLRVNVELPDDFAMDQTLSLYLLNTLPLLDPEAPDYSLDVITLIESILEDPDIILRKQLDKLKAEAVARMKLEGLEYEERMQELEKLEHPKPKRDFIYETFGAFARRHPWVGQEHIRPKSIAREMWEGFRSFADYVREYDLARSEGLLLRHLSGVYKVLRQTVPDGAKDEAVREIEAYLGAMIQQVDSSLLDEWEKMRDPSFARAETAEVRPPGAEDPARAAARQEAAFLAAVRTGIFTFLRALVVGDYEAAIEALAPPEDARGRPWTVERLRGEVEAYLADHAAICLDPNARNRRHTYLLSPEEEGRPVVQQVLVDPEEHCDWAAEFDVDSARWRERAEAALRLRQMGPMGSMRLA